MTQLYLIAICGDLTVAYTFICDHLLALQKESKIIAAFDKWAAKQDGECVGVELSYTKEGNKTRGIKLVESAGKFTFKK